MDDWQFQQIMDRLADMERAQQRANARIRMEVASLGITALLMAGLVWVSREGWFNAWWSWVVILVGYVGFMLWVGWTAQRIDESEGVSKPYKRL